MQCRTELTLNHCAAETCPECKMQDLGKPGHRARERLLMDPKYIPWQDLRSYFSFRRTAWIQLLHPIENILPDEHGSVAPHRCWGNYSGLSRGSFGTKCEPLAESTLVDHATHAQGQHHFPICHQLHAGDTQKHPCQ